ncbi:SPFH domain-containing protein [methanotrophic endosymbiont of Bathymodiolus puteoserpentis (Logatchev)]|jgi:membrane protease subunit (stomatin/prohibitin family)|uniref:SPFH domain-containing protein n=1 Tax=methanotrophic endosymbiont of Bathymodiolus puteoserpentis (Logatchev) TaxID=343235 RepID=UPI0013C5EF56|nr:SPFH domain-containing protein [methanotrophic endosymbiont of Bathymodiolus puteoserpentis (Logatchev)]SHE21846.1 Putative virion core protein (lumpy skin disease virus) [methanotrophic endosymbiont of Bathymodiolus puteoserpentis (Logatchev)]
MGLFDKLFGEFVDVIEWLDQSSDTMVYRFERYGNEIKYGAKLTVRTSQVAILVNEGKAADFFEPGMYELQTNNMPIMTTLENWPHGFQSPFKAEVYFFNMHRFVDLKWGTKNPIMLRDTEFGAVRLRAFGSYCVRINDPLTFIKEIVGTHGHFSTDDISDQLRNLILSRFASILGESKIPVLDLAGNYDDLSDYITAKIAPEFMAYGLEITKLLVENISLPASVEEALDKRTSMGVIGNLKDYTEFQAAEAMKAAAENPSGGASEGIGMGMGFALANKMSQSFASSPNNTTQSTPPPTPQQTQYFVALNGQQSGPFNLADLASQIKSGTVTRQTLIWNQSLVAWTKAAEVAELVNYFSVMPPPLPTQ